MRSSHTTHEAVALTTVRRNLLRLLAVASVALFAATVAWPAAAAHAERGLTTGAAAEDSCADDDYDCWYKYFKDLMGGDSEEATDACADDDYDCWYRYFKDLIDSSTNPATEESCADDDYDCWYKYFKDLMGGSDDDKSAPRRDGPRDLSQCVEGIDYAGTGCVEDYTGGGTKPVEPAPRPGPSRTLAAR